MIKNQENYNFYNRKTGAKAQQVPQINSIQPIYPLKYGYPAPPICENHQMAITPSQPIEAIQMPQVFSNHLSCVQECFRLENKQARSDCIRQCNCKYLNRDCPITCGYCEPDPSSPTGYSEYCCIHYPTGNYCFKRPCSLPLPPPPDECGWSDYLYCWTVWPFCKIFCAQSPNKEACYRGCTGFFGCDCR